MKKILLSIILALMLSTFLYTQTKEEESKFANDETNATVPALDKFHKIIVPIWHKYWPAKDIEALKKALPEVEKLAADIYKSELPGILREKKEKWAKAVDTLKVFVANYKTAAAGSDSAIMLKAAEKLHWQYEMMLRVVKPKVKALDNFHQILYNVYHYYLPEFKLEELKKAIPELSARRDSVMAVNRVFPLKPERFKDIKMYEKSKAAYDKQTDNFYKSRKELSDALDELAKVMKETEDKDKIKKAIEFMHKKYQDCEAAFE